MTTTEICALIALIISTGIVYWAGYRGGLVNGRTEGIEEGKSIQKADSSEEIRELQLLLEHSRGEHKKLYTHYQRAWAASKLGEDDRQALLDIAEKLRIAAATFNALRTGKAITRETNALRDQALAMAALLEPVVQEDAA